MRWKNQVDPVRAVTLGDWKPEVVPLLVGIRQAGGWAGRLAGRGDQAEAAPCERLEQWPPGALAAGADCPRTGEVGGSCGAWSSWLCQPCGAGQDLWKGSVSLGGLLPAGRPPARLTDQGCPHCNPPARPDAGLLWLAPFRRRKNRPGQDRGGSRLALTHG